MDIYCMMSGLAEHHSLNLRMNCQVVKYKRAMGSRQARIVSLTEEVEDHPTLALKQ